MTEPSKRLIRLLTLLGKQMNNKKITLSNQQDEMPASANSSKVMVKPVANAFQILRHLNQTQNPERSVDIARQLAINPSTCFNILRTLVDQDILEFNDKGKTYSVGLGLLKLVKSTMTDSQRIQSARHIMSDLASRYRVTITVWKKVANRLVLLGSEASPAGLSISMSEGQRVPALMGASGRILASYSSLSPNEIKREFENIRWAKSINFSDYWQQVEQAKQQGWAIDKGFFSNGITTVAVPVFNGDQQANFTLSAVMISGTLEGADLQNFITHLKQASNKIARCLF